MTFRFSQRSLDNMAGVHPDLVRVLKRAIKQTDIDFVVIRGVRTLERQQELFEQGATKTMNSRHLTGHAVDLVPWSNGIVSWDWPLYHRLSVAIKKAAKQECVAITWGGDWRSFKDGPHFELKWSEYPK